MRERNSYKFVVSKRDGDIVLAEEGQIAHEDFRTVELFADGGSLFVDAGVLPARDTERGIGISARVYGDVPEWIESVFGKAVYEAACAITDDANPITVTCDEFGGEPRTVWGLKRIAQGMWMRRYWPVSKRRDILRTRTELFDLELAALLCDPYIGQCFPDDFIDLLLLPRQTQAIQLISEIENVTDVVFDRFQAVLSLILEWYVDYVEDNAESDPDRADIQLTELGLAIERLDRTVKERQAAFAARGAASVNTSSDDTFWIDQRFGISELALAAGDDGGLLQDAFESGSMDVDWTQNVHGVIDAASSIEWQGKDPSSVEFWVRAQRPEEFLDCEVWLRVYLAGRQLPVVTQMTKEEESEFITASLVLPNLDIELVDVHSITNYMRPKTGQERLEQDRWQGQALAWAENRIKELKEWHHSDQGETLPAWSAPRNERDMAVPWLAECESVETLWDR